MLTFETDYHASSNETIVFVRSSNGGGERALLAAFNSYEAGLELANFLNWMAQGYARHAIERATTCSVNQHSDPNCA